MKALQILIRWLHQKPADLNVHGFFWSGLRTLIYIRHFAIIIICKVMKLRNIFIKYKVYLKKLYFTCENKRKKVFQI